MEQGYAGVEITEGVEQLLDGGTYKFRKGKVRDIIESDDFVYLFTTDRVSAFDVVMPTLIPGRGKILEKISKFWFNFFSDIPNHFHKGDDWCATRGVVSQIIYNQKGDHLPQVCKKLDMLPIEFVVRGYLAGSYWKECNARSDLWCEKTSMHIVGDWPLFTPATKAPEGEHDKNIPLSESCKIVRDHLGWSSSAARVLMAELQEVCCDMYRRAHKHALMRGIIIADTKFEFGMNNGRIYLADEVLTPDSSRFWSLAEYEIGRDQDNFDKQILRNYLQELVDKGEWDKTSPGPNLPDELVERIISRYNDIYGRLVG